MSDFDPYDKSKRWKYYLRRSDDPNRDPFRAFLPLPPSDVDRPTDSESEKESENLLTNQTSSYPETEPQLDVIPEPAVEPAFTEPEGQRNEPPPPSPPEKPRPEEKEQTSEKPETNRADPDHASSPKSYIRWDDSQVDKPIEGKVVSFSETTGGTDYRGSEVGHIDIKTKVELVHIDLSLTVLKNEITEEKGVKQGGWIRIVYEGEREAKSSGRTYKSFSIEPF